MVDFGSLTPAYFTCGAMGCTKRYSSLKIDESKGPFSACDEFESLGFVLLDVFFGLVKSPLGREDKRQILKNAHKGDYGCFFQEYFLSLSGESIYDHLHQLALKSLPQ
jgi:hypothetical protein